LQYSRRSKHDTQPETVQGKVRLEDIFPARPPTQMVACNFLGKSWPRNADGDTMITPKSFDIDTAKEMLGDARMRVVEAKARADADAGISDSPKRDNNASYWDRVMCDMEFVVYTTTHHKRLERIKRIKQKELEKQA
jgi:hypothetical protein